MSIEYCQGYTDQNASSILEGTWLGLRRGAREIWSVSGTPKWTTRASQTMKSNDSKKNQLLL